MEKKTQPIRPLCMREQVYGPVGRRLQAQLDVTGTDNSERDFEDREGCAEKPLSGFKIYSTGEKAAQWLRQQAEMVEAKNRSYGDSLGDPIRVFSKANTLDSIRVMIDSKLSRIARGSEWQGEDTIRDLVGYLALLAVSSETSGEQLAQEETKAYTGAVPEAAREVVSEGSQAVPRSELRLNHPLRGY